MITYIKGPKTRDGQVDGLWENEGLHPTGFAFYGWQSLCMMFSMPHSRLALILAFRLSYYTRSWTELYYTFTGTKGKQDFLRLR